MTYDSNGGTTYSSEKYTVNTKVTLDKLPTKTSYQFTGWSLDKDLKQSATNVVMDKDKTVYAGWKKVSESVLDLENTYAYIIGFPEDYRTGERSNDPSLFPVKPTAPITRAEVTTVFFRMLTDSMREKNWTTSNSYTDVKADHWFNNAVSVMTKLGIVQGVGNDQFKPNAPITRGEMGAIAARFARMMDSTTTTTMSFTDIAGHWAEADILYAASVGWVKGDTDGSYRPNDKITRAEFMTLANRMLEREPENESDLLEGMINGPTTRTRTLGTTWRFRKRQTPTSIPEKKARQRTLSSIMRSGSSLKQSETGELWKHPGQTQTPLIITAVKCTSLRRSNHYTAQRARPSEALLFFCETFSYS